jgi:hypothetical protein
MYQRPRYSIRLIHLDANSWDTGLSEVAEAACHSWLTDLANMDASAINWRPFLAQLAILAVHFSMLLWCKRGTHTSGTFAYLLLMMATSLALGVAEAYGPLRPLEKFMYWECFFLSVCAAVWPADEIRAWLRRQLGL